ncbi:MAG TPA: ABC transporter permease [Cerasibacillus sp.]|uniref:ABC transporter permease n=1 Tax=Cerasibacillus sp. TaxID=2498711 RepID=UPI002F420685
MMYSLLQAEWHKLRRTQVYGLLLVGPLLSLLIGIMNPMFKEIDEADPWYMLLLFMNLPYALLFLPLVTGVIAGIICRYEHQAGGWKQLATLPVNRANIYVVKFIMIALIVLAIQLTYGIVVYLAGTINGYEEAFPLLVVLKMIIGGWLATFPMIAIQLWAAMNWRSFAVAFTINVVLTLPSILAINSERFGPYYPWAQAFFMMYVNDESGMFFVPLTQFLLVTCGSFIIFFALGLLTFFRKSIS